MKDEHITVYHPPKSKNLFWDYLTLQRGVMYNEKSIRPKTVNLRDLRRICKFLGVETAILLANAMVSSRLDYCNSLFYGVSKSNIAKLQRVQNALCRIIFRLDKMSFKALFQCFIKVVVTFSHNKTFW